MQWSDEGFVLSVRRHGETSAIVNLLSHDHGRHVGLVRGGDSSRQRATLQPGNLVAVTWRARLEEHLGTYTIEPVLALAAVLLDRPGPLAALISVCSLIAASLPEREPHPQLFDDLSALMALLDGPDWRAAYTRWELALLGEVGFGLDLSTCALTGTNDNLNFVSPKSGRAVSASAGEPYRDRLLPLPGFLSGGDTATPEGLAAGLRLTGYFIERHILMPHGRSMPDARTRLARYIADDPDDLSQQSN
jgi:DNA repair protein RecO (recombination protein O)